MRVVRILLRRDEINPDNPNKSGKTLLEYAARNGHVEMAEISYCSEGTTSTPISQMTKAEHRYSGLLLLGIRE